MFRLLNWYLEKLFDLSAENYSITIVYDPPELTDVASDDETITALGDMYVDIFGLSSPPMYNICTRLTSFR